MIYLVVIFSILYFIMCWRRLDLALAILIMSLPAYQLRFNFFGLPMTVLELMILIAFFVWLAKETNLKNLVAGKYKLKDYLENRERRIRYPFGAEIILWLIVSLVAVGVAHWSNQAFGIWKAYFFEPVIVFILVLNVFRPGKKCRFNYDKIFIPLALSAVLVSMAAIYQKLTGSFIFNELWAAEATRRSTGLFAYPNALGLYLGPIILLLAGWLAVEARKKTATIKIIFISATILISLFAIYCAKSEGAIIALAGSLMFIGFIISKKIRIAGLFLIALIGLGVLIQAIIPDEKLKNPAESQNVINKIVYKVGQNIENNKTLNKAKEYAFDKAYLKDLSGEIRKQQWRETWQMLSDGRLIFGAGLNNYQNTMKPYHQEGIFFNWERDPDFQRKVYLFDDKYKSEHWQPVETYMYPHNIVLNFWTELGFFGMIVFFWITLKFYFKGLRLYVISKREENYQANFIVLGVMGAMFTIIIHGLVDVPYFKNDLAVLFWLLVAMLSLMNLTIVNAHKKYGKK